MRNDIKTRFQPGHQRGFKKGFIPWNKGKKHTEETKKKIPELLILLSNYLRNNGSKM